MWQTEYAEHLVPTFTIVFLTSFAVCAAILIFKHRLLALAERRGDLNSVQAMHTVPTPRLGGAAVVFGIVSSTLLVSWTPLERKGTIIYLVTLSPILLAGLLEDIGIAVSPKIRLIAAVTAGLLTSIAWGIWVKSVGIPGIDDLLTFAPIAIALTVLGAAGVTNAFNLIDGLNGLAGFVTLSTSFALAVVANGLELYNYQAMLIMLTFAVAGFLFFNFPAGKIFLGDAGAYTLGHTLVWVAIALTNVAPEVSPWAILLIFFWPIADTMLSIWRRRRRGLRADQPDRLHFHQLALRYIEIRFFGRKKRAIANPIATLLLMPFAIAPQIAGVLLIDNQSGAQLAVVMFAIVFVGTYLFGLRHTKQMRRRRRTVS
ncbi:MAG: glycosyltransferase [Paracoccaceae bacterium]|jgi:UDP-N-acetylmuramyl pentapeptide phosphotransferase/UDP-N-acetylglucosamine-1-phosphate transferase|nr:glycosyltransferase [Paracoccaceae bacterium]